jgi:hypothetical protein
VETLRALRPAKLQIGSRPFQLQAGCALTDNDCVSWTTRDYWVDWPRSGCVSIDTLEVREGRKTAELLICEANGDLAAEAWQVFSHKSALDERHLLDLRWFCLFDDHRGAKAGPALATAALLLQLISRLLTSPLAREVFSEHVRLTLAALSTLSAVFAMLIWVCAGLIMAS